MRRLVAITALCLMPFGAPAQDASEEEDKGFLTNWLEENLSGGGREVTREGFQGALSSEATIDKLTIADDEGIWITVEDAVLDWNRSALLRGNLQVTQLSAGSIVLVRPPQTEAAAPSPEATEFQLPDLPVSIRIDQILAESVTLGEAILGEEAVVSLDGSVSLAGGEGQAELTIARIDDKTGSLALKASYANETKVLDLAFNVKEEPEGILVTLLDIPGAPSVDLSVDGSGPTSDFKAEIALATDGSPRVTGTVQLVDQTATDGAVTNTFAADLSGDLAPLLDEQYHEFVGSSAELSVAGARLPDGRLELERFRLKTAALDLAGTLSLSADGLPEAFDIKGTIAAIDGPDVVLPIAGPETRLGSATISGSFQAGRSDAWSLNANFLGFEREGITIADGVLQAEGFIRRTGSGDAEQREVTANIRTEVFGLDMQDPALSQAVGEELTATATVDWQEGGPVRIGSLDASSGDLGLAGSAIIDGFDDRFNIAANATATAGSLGRFSELAGLPLGGAAEIRLDGEFQPLGGAFDAVIEGTTTGLELGEPDYYDLVEGDGSFKLDARRDTAGLTIRTFTARTAGVSIDASGLVKTEASDLKLDVALTDAGKLVPQLDGPARLTGTARQSGPGWNVDLAATGPGLSAEVQGLVEDGASDLNLSASLDNAGIFVPALSGPASLSGNVRQDGPAWNIDLQGSGPGLEAAVDGVYQPNASDLNITARLDNLGRFVSGINGPASVSGNVRQDGPDYVVDLEGTGPGGSSLTASGTVAGSFETVDLKVDGSVPIGLANNFLSPSTDVQGTANLDLAISGPPALNSVSGTITTSGARVSAPGLRVALRRIDATVRLSQGQANVSVDGGFRAGGRVAVTGTLGLSAPFPADLQIDLINADFTDEPTYTTTLNGNLTLRGGLQGGGEIAGRIELGETEVRLAATTSTAGIPDITHVGDSAAARRTRARAGLVEASDEGAASPQNALGLDIVIVAPGRIFIRGRGLDTELGGRLRLTGTTANVIPIGQFDLIRGRLDILGKRIEMEEGRLLLQGSFNPTIRLVASTETDNANIRIVTEGTPQEPQITFESDPDLPDDEILANLLFGKSISSISPLQAAQLAAAVATLAGSGGDGVIGRIRSQFNLDDLDVTTDESGAAALRAGKYISENVYTDVEVNSQGQSEINLNLDITDNITAKGSAGTDGNTGIGIFFERDY